MRTLNSTIALATFLAVTAIGCSYSDSMTYACTAIAVPGIQISAVDSASNQQIQNESVRGIATRRAPASPAYADTAFASGGVGAFTLILAYEQAGTFTVTVDADGYRTWTKDNVVVAKGEHGCHVVTVNLTARMQPVTP